MSSESSISNKAIILKQWRKALQCLHDNIDDSYSNVKMWRKCMEMFKQIQNYIPLDVQPGNRFKHLMAQCDQLNTENAGHIDKRLGFYMSHLLHSMKRYGDIHLFDDISAENMPKCRLRLNILSSLHRNYILINESFEAPYERLWSDNSSAHILAIIQNKENVEDIIR